MGKRPGRGAVLRKKEKSEAAYAAKNSGNDDQIIFNLVGSRPRILGPENDHDCKFSVKFADGVKGEVQEVKEHVDKMERKEESLVSDTHRSSFWFFR